VKSRWAISAAMVRFFFERTLLLLAVACDELVDVVVVVDVVMLLAMLSVREVSTRRVSVRSGLRDRSLGLERPVTMYDG
jgi:hypothetical protein